MPSRLDSAAPCLAPRPVRPANGGASPALPHWDRLAPGRPREYTGQTYDTSIVKRVYPDEVYGWEHTRASGALIELARRDAWEAHGVPPIRLAYSETGVAGPRGTLHYAIEDGHHRIAAARRAREGRGEPVGVPAMVTSRWTDTDETVRSTAGRGMPMMSPDPSLPRGWNAGGKALVIHAPETIERKLVWGTPELQLLLPGSAASLTLADIAGRLDGFQRPDEFLRADRGRSLVLRITLGDVSGRREQSSRLGTLYEDVRLADVDIEATRWSAILRDTRPMREVFPTNAGADYPLMEVRLQQGEHFIDEHL